MCLHVYNNGYANRSFINSKISKSNNNCFKHFFKIIYYTKNKTSLANQTFVQLLLKYKIKIKFNCNLHHCVLLAQASTTTTKSLAMRANYFSPCFYSSLCKNNMYLFWFYNIFTLHFSEVTKTLTRLFTYLNKCLIIY